MPLAIPIVVTPYTTYASPFVCIHNPIIYTFQFSNAAPATVYTDLKAYVTLYDHRTSDTLITTLYFDSYVSGGVTYADGDISEVLKYVFSAVTHLGVPDYKIDLGATEYIRVDYGFCYRDSVGTLVTSSALTLGTYLRPTRGVAQIGENQNLLAYSTPVAKFLTKFDKIYIFQYNGSVLPSEFSFIYIYAGGVDTIVTTSAGSPVTIPHSGTASDEVIHIRPSVAWDKYQVYWRTVASPTALSELKYAKLITIKENPFFVKWQNAVGDWDYWCFSKRQTLTNQSSEIKTVRSYIYNTYISRKSHTKIDQSAATKVIAGSTNLNRNEWDTISWIANSPTVEYYDITNAVWYEILVEGASNSYMNDKPAGKLEFSFVMPEIQLQF